MGICAGDVTMLLAQRIIAGLQIDDERYRRVNRLVAQEIAFVGVAQMDDLYFGYLDGSVEEEKIYRLYRYKTGRYTFSLPLALGAVFAGMPDPGVERLMQYGEELGVVFQVIDDDIGLFGETEATGKPVGSDVSANKKTLHRRYFLDTPAAATTAYFGRSNLSRTEVEELRRAMRDQGVHKRIEELLDRHAARARELAEELARDHMPAEAAERTRSFLHDLVEYNVSRRA
jgi:geranylgeranyl diphosphate synthase type I